MPTNVFFSPNVRTEQNLYEDLIIESLKLYGQDVYYIPRETITPDEILNEEYSKYARAYMVEMYISNVDGFGGEGDLYTKFGLEIRDQASFIVSRRQFSRLVSIDDNAIREERPREGDLIYLPLSKGLFEIKFVEHESPFYQLSKLPTYEMQCELYEYSAEKFDTGIGALDYYETAYGPQSVIQIRGGTSGFSIGEKVQQLLFDDVEVSGEVSDFTPTTPFDSVPRVADITITNIIASDGSLRSFEKDGLLLRIDSINDSDWVISNVYDINDEGKFIPQEPLAQNSAFENRGDDIIDFSENNPFGDSSAP
jgi:hypothetical protein